MSLSNWSLPPPLPTPAYSYPTSTTDHRHDTGVLPPDLTLIPPMSPMMTGTDSVSDVSSFPPLPDLPVAQPPAQQHQRVGSGGKKRAAARSDNQSHHRKRSSFGPQPANNVSVPSTSSAMTAQQKTKDLLLSSLATSAQEKGTKFRSRTLADLDLHEKYLQQCQTALAMGIPVPPPPLYGLGAVATQIQLPEQHRDTAPISNAASARTSTRSRRSRRRSQSSYMETSHGQSGDKSLDRKSLVCTYVDPLTQHQCNKSFTKPSSLQRHRKLHQRDAELQQQQQQQQAQPITYACQQPHCGLSFGDVDAYMRHLRAHSNAAKPHLCQYPTCDTSFDQLTELYSHMQLQHPNPLNDMLQMLRQPDRMDDNAWQRWVDAVREMNNSEKLLQRHSPYIAERTPSSDLASMFAATKSPPPSDQMAHLRSPGHMCQARARLPSYDLPEPTTLASNPDRWTDLRHIISPLPSLTETTAALRSLSIDDFLQLPSPSFNNNSVKSSVRRLAYAPSDDISRLPPRAPNSVWQHSTHSRTTSQDTILPYVAPRPPLIPMQSNHSRIPPNVDLPASNRQSPTCMTESSLRMPRLGHSNQTSPSNNVPMDYSYVMRRRDSMIDSPSALSKLLHLPRNSLLLPGYSPTMLRTPPALPAAAIRTPSLTPLPLLQAMSASPLPTNQWYGSPDAMSNMVLKWPASVHNR